MKSKKFRQALLVILIFDASAALIAYGLSFLFQKMSWEVPFGTGVAFLLLSVFLFIPRKRHPRFSVAIIACNALAAALFLCALFVRNGRFPFLGTLLVPLAAGATYLLLILFFIPVGLRNKKIYIIFSYLVWLGLAGGLGIWLVARIAGDYTILYLLSFLAVAFLAAGSLFRAQELQELLAHMALPALFAAGSIGILIFLLLSCEDSCNGCGDSCTCDGGGPSDTSHKQKRTTMSQLSGDR